MRKTLRLNVLIFVGVLAALLGAGAAGVAQAGDRLEGAKLKQVVGKAARTAVSAPLWSLVAPPAYPAADENSPVRKIADHRLPKVPKVKAGAGDTDAAVQTSAGLAALTMPAPLLTFAGISNADNQAQFGYRVLPPDTNGDVGPNHYVQTVNLLFQAFDKVTGVPLLPHPAKISSLFAGFGGACESTDDGDPVVMYDPLADRWLISQFSTSGPPFHQCAAVSQTGDPTGTYFLYDFVLPNSKFNDYPKFGVWPDAYYMTDNQFTSLTGSFSGAGVYALDRSKMLVGDPSATYIYFDLNTVDPTIGSLLPADMDGTPPPAGTPNYIAYFTANEFGDPTDGLRVFAFHPDFVMPANSTFTEIPESPIATAAFDPVLNCGGSGEDCIPQPSPAKSNAKLDGLADRLMHRLQYRNFGDHESLVVTHTVDVNGASHAGIRYYEVRRALPGGAFSIHEQASFAPDANHRWMGSAAMDRQGNIAVGYSVSGTSTFPSIRYAGRLATDPPGGLYQGEVTLIAGGGSQTSSSSRWGDYSMLAVDPVDDCTFWYTTEYYGASSSAAWLTRIGKFRFPQCAPVASGSATPTGTPTPVPTATGSPTVTPTLPAAATPTSTPSGVATSSPTSTPTSAISTPTRTPSPAVTPTVRPVVSLDATQDAWIQQDSVTRNKGNDTGLHVKSASGKLRRALLQFDLTSISPTACIGSATLKLTLTKVQSKARTYAVHRVTASWTEGNGASNSGVTWSRRDGVTVWGSAGGDFAPTATATTPTGTTNGVALEWDVTGDVRAMLAGAVPNTGWLLKDADEGSSVELVFASRENGTIQKRPQLMVTFAACP